MKKILLILIFFATYSSCKKDKNYTFTGTIYKNCDKEPAANREFYLRQEIVSGLTNISGGEIAFFSTDENGNFSVTFEDDNGAPIDLLANPSPVFAGSPVMYGVDPDDLDLGNLYINNRATIDFHLDVNNSYTNSDTLIILGIGLEIIGPFTNGLIHTVEDYSWTPHYYEATQDDKFGIAYGVNPYSTGSFTYEYIEPTGCEERDEITIKIE